MLIAGPASDGYVQLVGSALPAGTDQAAWGIAGEAFSPDGRLVAVLAGRELRLLDARTGKPWLTPIVTPGQLTGAVFSPRGDLVATLDTDDRRQLWATATGTSVGPPFTALGESFQQFTAGQVIAFSPDGRLLAVARPGGSVQL